VIAEWVSKGENDGRRFCAVSPEDVAAATSQAASRLADGVRPWFTVVDDTLITRSSDL
jgi:hypothetical protein